MTDIAQAAQTPLVDLLRHVHPDATIEVTEPNGWHYYAMGIGRTMHRAADQIERYKRQIETQKYNMIMFLLIGFVLGGFLGAIGINYINCLYIP